MAGLLGETFSPSIKNHGWLGGVIRELEKGGASSRKGFGGKHRLQIENTLQERGVTSNRKNRGGGSF